MHRVPGVSLRPPSGRFTIADVSSLFKPVMGGVGVDIYFLLTYRGLRIGIYVLLHRMLEAGRATLSSEVTLFSLLVPCLLMGWLSIARDWA
jgi:hypothetical protein